MILCICVLIIFLAIASVFDFFTLSVPLWITPVALALRVIFLFLAPDPSVTFTCILTAIVLFGCMCVLMLIGHSGGADALLTGVMGFYLGFGAVYALFLAFLLSIPNAAYIQLKRKETAYPFVPYLLFGTVLWAVLRVMLW